MKSISSFIIFFTFALTTLAQNIYKVAPASGYEDRIKKHIDTIRIFDTHEHLIDPDDLKKAGFLDFALLFLQNGFNDLVSSGMPDTLFNTVFSETISPGDKWRIIKPYWQNAYNTSNNRLMMKAINDLYGISALDSSTVIDLSAKMKNTYSGEWFDHVLHDLCHIDYVVQDGGKIRKNKNYVKYAGRFNPWLTVRSKFAIDSLAILQIDPIYTLEGFVKSMNSSCVQAIENGMQVIKIDIAYNRSLKFENVSVEAARKVFRNLINGNEDLKISKADARPLQDYMVHQLLKIAEKQKIPVAFHTGFQSGNGNFISNANPELLTNLFMEFPGVNFVLFHGSYPYGGELSTLAKNFKNVFIDMNWTYAISPEYSRRYLSEWLETVPMNKIMAFGGDQRMVELTYGSLIVAKQVISNVLIEKVQYGYFSENEATEIASKILHDNGIKFYNIR